MKIKSFKSTKLFRLKEPKIRVPADYPWKTLNWLVDDLKLYLDEGQYQACKSIIAQRNRSKYKLLSEEWIAQSIGLFDISLSKRRAMYLIASLLKKFKFDGDDCIRKNAALEKFYDAEWDCRFFNYYGFKKVTYGRSEEMTCIYTYMLSFLRKLLGDVPNIRDLTRKSRHGPGSTLSAKSRWTSSYYKMLNWPYDCTEAARPYAVLAIQDDPRWIGALEDSYRSRYNIPKWEILDMPLFWSRIINTVAGNKITFVPKNADIDRSIAIEPTLNVFLQLGIDGWIRKRLKRWSVDLDDQSRNQRFARLGSVDGTYSTIDLRSASDTVSKKLCEVLLDPQWYDLLMRLASPSGELVDGTVVEYEKISSMGNGFTFALESAIFSAAAFSVQRHKYGKIDPSVICVYGDDLIVPTDMADDLIRVLANLGFATNIDKTFISGPFRESCGTDWYLGDDIRPVFLTDPPKVIDDLFVHYNLLRRIFYRYFDIYSFVNSRNIKKWIPKEFHIFGPCSDEQFNSHLHSSKPTIDAVYDASCWKYQIVIRGSKKHKDCNEFFFRKLMHNLQDLPLSQKWEKRCDTSGSRFDVTSRDATTLQTKYSLVDFWQDSYASV